MAERRTQRLPLGIDRVSPFLLLLVLTVDQSPQRRHRGRVGARWVKKSKTGPHHSHSASSYVYRCFVLSRQMGPTARLPPRRVRSGWTPHDNVIDGGEWVRRYSLGFGRAARTGAPHSRERQRQCQPRRQRQRDQTRSQQQQSSINEKSAAEPGGPASTSKTERRIRRKKRAARRTNQSGLFGRGKAAVSKA